MASLPSRETLYLVDSFSLIFQVFHALPEMTSPAGLPTNALFGFTKDMMYLRSERKPSYLVCLFDVSGPTFREELYKEYKAHRAPMPDNLQLQIPLIQEMLEAMRIPSLSKVGFEADDLIATLAVAGAERGCDVYICSSDKDCRQLLSDRVKIFNLRKQITFDAESLLADWGIRPEQVIDYQTLVGDSVDNVPGVVGVGPKTASQYLQQYQTLENLLIHIDDLKGKKKDNLQTAIPFFETSRRLVRLDTQVDIEMDWNRWRLQDWDAPKLSELFRGWGFHRFADLARASIKTSVPAPRKASEQGSLFDEPPPPVLDAPPPSTPTPARQATDYRLVDTAETFERFVLELSQQPRFAVDLETTSLDPQVAELVGLAFSWQTLQGWYLPVRGPMGDPILGVAEVLARLKPILEDPNVGKVNQNIKYDWQILKRHGIRLTGVAGDSMIADYLLAPGVRSHGLDVLAEAHLNRKVIPISDLIGKGKKQLCMDQVPTAQVAEYAAEDADVAWTLCEKLEPQLAERGWRRGGSGISLYDELEVPLIEVLAEMEFTGIRLDVPLLHKMGREMEVSLAQLESDLHRLAGRTFNINSVQQLRKILFEEMGFKPEKKTAIGGESSTNQETLEILASQGHEFPQRLLEHRKIAKLKGTYVDALPSLVSPRSGRIHASFNQTVAATGRLSSSDPNLQNIPIRNEMGGQIRQAFLPEPGWLLLTADYSQIELRLLAHFSGDETMRQAYADNHDIHARVAAQVFGVPEAEVNAEQRRMAKTVNFGIIYGISPFGLAQRLLITKDEAGRFIDAYFARYPRVLEYQDNLLANCRQKGYVATILGRRRPIEGLRAVSKFKSRTQPEREAMNMEIQGSAADLIKVAMLNLHRRLQRDRLRSRLLLQIHDELVFEVPPEEREVMQAVVQQEMTGALSDRLTVPICIDLGFGPNWLETT